MSYCHGQYNVIRFTGREFLGYIQESMKFRSALRSKSYGIALAGSTSSATVSWASSQTSLTLAFLSSKWRIGSTYSQLCCENEMHSCMLNAWPKVLRVNSAHSMLGVRTIEIQILQYSKVYGVESSIFLYPSYWQTSKGVI